MELRNDIVNICSLTRLAARAAHGCSLAHPGGMGAEFPQWENSWIDNKGSLIGEAEKGILSYFQRAGRGLSHVTVTWEDKMR